MIDLPGSGFFFSAAGQIKKLPEHPGTYFSGLVVLIAVSLSIASVIGLAVKESASSPGADPLQQNAADHKRYEKNAQQGAERLQGRLGGRHPLVSP